MLSGLKEVFEAAEERIKSPILGSIVITFILFNWKAVYFLIFSGELARMKFNYFDDSTTLWSIYLPIPIGIAAALLAPRISYIGAQLVQEPILNKRILQIESAHKVLLEKQKLAETRSKLAETQERELISQARRDMEVEEFGDERVRANVQNKIDDLRRDSGKPSEDSPSLPDHIIVKVEMIRQKIENLRDLSSHCAENSDDHGYADAQEKIKAAYGEIDRLLGLDDVPF